MPFFFIQSLCSWKFIYILSFAQFSCSCGISEIVMASILCFKNLKALVRKRGLECPQSQICPWHQDPHSRVWYWWMDGGGEQVWVGDSFPGTRGSVPSMVLRGSNRDCGQRHRAQLTPAHWAPGHSPQHPWAEDKASFSGWKFVLLHIALGHSIGKILKEVKQEFPLGAYLGIRIGHDWLNVSAVTGIFNSSFSVWIWCLSLPHPASIRSAISVPYICLWDLTWILKRWLRLLLTLPLPPQICLSILPPSWNSLSWCSKLTASSRPCSKTSHIIYHEMY